MWLGGWIECSFMLYVMFVYGLCDLFVLIVVVLIVWLVDWVVLLYSEVGSSDYEMFGSWCLLG